MDALDTETLLQPVLANLADVVANIDADQLGLATPNADRDVAALRSLSMILWEYLVHGWDLAVATGQTWSPDPAAAQAALAFAPGLLTPDFQGEGKAFGPPVDVSADAGPFEKLPGLSGRDPAWTRPNT